MRADSELAAVEPPHPFSLADTLKSGQLFHWEPCAWRGIDGWAGCIGDRPAWVAQPGGGPVLTLARDRGAVERYFGLDHPMDRIHAGFPRGDEPLARAVAFCPGIRVARQPPWECLATFITSSLKRVEHIRAISLRLRRRFGPAHALAGRVFHSYPAPEVLAGAGEAALRECGLGYRAKSLQLAAAAAAAGSLDLAAVEAEPDLAAARAALLELHGVGDKIANCTLLFGCGRWGAFPVDVWVERILRSLYRKRLKGPRLQAWAERHFGPEAGYAQQYLFHFARKTL